MSPLQIFEHEQTLYHIWKQVVAEPGGLSREDVADIEASLKVAKARLAKMRSLMKSHYQDETTIIGGEA